MGAPISSSDHYDYSQMEYPPTRSCSVNSLEDCLHRSTDTTPGSCGAPALPEEFLDESVAPTIDNSTRDLRAVQQSGVHESLPPLGISKKIFAKCANEHFCRDAVTFGKYMFQDEILQKDIDEALSNLTGRFISERDLTQLDALIFSVFNSSYKTCLMPKLSSKLIASVTRLYVKSRLSYPTFAFLLEAVITLEPKASSAPSFAQMLAKQYSEPDDADDSDSLPEKITRSLVSLHVASP